jgi:ATP-dependent DNA helicase PIF1
MRKDKTSGTGMKASWNMGKLKRGDIAIGPRNLSSIEDLLIPEMPHKHRGKYSSDPDDLSEIEILPEYEFILKAAKNGCPSFFVTGKAGTGKSTMVKWLSSQLTGCAIVCPTAIAAVNVSGDTIHSFFGLPPVHIDPDKEFRTRAKSHVVLENLNYLIIDEVSMVLPNIVDAMSNILKRVRRSHKPFGGVPTLFVGDLLQLPPVVSSKEESIYYSHRYKTPHFFSADVFKQQEIIPVCLTKVRRQTDIDFIGALNHIRLNRDHRDHVALFNRLCYRDKKRDSKTESTTLVPTNTAAKQINTRKLNALPGQLCIYDAEISGRIPANKWKLPVPDRLELKINARIILLKNNKPHWVNGNLAEIVGLEDDHIRVRKMNTNNVLVVNRAIWRKHKYTYDYQSRKIEKEVVGTFEQFPIALGWAITIHKSQGMTLENLTLDLGRGAFCEGQTYVALSRAKTMDGITLSQPIKMQDVKVNPIVLEFYKNLGMED